VRERAALVADVLLDLGPEAFDQRLDRTDRRVAQRAERLAADVAADGKEELAVALAPLAVFEAVEEELHPVRPLAARRALATRFMVEELREARHRPHQAGRVVHHDHRRRAEHRARLGHAVEIHLEVDLRRRQDRRRGAAGDERLERPALVHAAGLVEQIAERDAERELIGPRPVDMARDGVELRSRVALVGADPLEPVGAAHQDVRHVAQRLDVVDHGRLAEGADDGGEGRFHPRLAALAFERFEHPGLFTADVGAGAAMHVHVELEARAHRVVAQDAAVVGIADRPFEDRRRLGVFAANVDVAGVRLDRPAADGAPLDELVRVEFHQQAVLEGARLGLVGVAHQVARLRLADEAPLHAGREAGAAAPAKARLLDLLDDRGRLHLERLGEPFIAARLLVPGERQGVGIADVAGEDRFKHGRHYLRPRTICTVRLGVRFS